MSKKYIVRLSDEEREELKEVAKKLKLSERSRISCLTSTLIRLRLKHWF